MLGLAACGVLSGCPPRGGDLLPLAPGNYWKYEIQRLQADDSVVKDSLEWRIASVTTGDLGEQRYLLDGRTEYFVRRGDLVGYAVDEGIWNVHMEGKLQSGVSFPAALVNDSLPGPQQFVPGPEDTPKPPEMVAERSSGTKRLHARHVKVKTPAGTFRRCVQIEHERGAFRGIKTYAPGIGMIRSELFGRDDPNKPLIVQLLVEYDIHEDK